MRAYYSGHIVANPIHQIKFCFKDKTLVQHKWSVLSAIE